MKFHHILPALAVLTLCAPAVMAQDATQDAAPAARAEKTLADMWERKSGHDKPGHDKPGHDKPGHDKPGHDKPGKHHHAKGEKRADWKKDKEKLKAMTPEEREKFLAERAAARKAEIEARLAKLPPEKQEEMRARMAEYESKREALRKELMALPPEERAARMEQMHKEAGEKFRLRRTAYFERKWNAASAEERADFCAKTVDHCTGEDKPRLCVTAQEKCATE